MTHLVVVQVVNALTFQKDLPFCHTARWLQQANDGSACERFPGTGLTHHAQNLAGLNVKRNIVQRSQRTVAVGEFHHQVFNL